MTHYTSDENFVFRGTDGEKCVFDLEGRQLYFYEFCEKYPKYIVPFNSLDIYVNPVFRNGTTSWVVSIYSTQMQQPVLKKWYQFQSIRTAVNGYSVIAHLGTKLKAIEKADRLVKKMALKETIVADFPAYHPFETA